MADHRSGSKLTVADAFHHKIQVGTLTERVLSTRQLNRALLARQLLLERARLPIPRALERIAGLQTQYAPSAYVGLWSRLHDFQRDSLTKALERRRVVQGTLMRVTIHMVSHRDFVPLVAGIRRARRDWWLRVHRGEVTDLDMEQVAARLRGYLVEGPRRAPEIAEYLRANGFPDVAWSGAGLWLDMVRAPPSGTWAQRRADLYGLADGWLEPSGASEAEGLEHLFRRYLGGFGPASLNDVASWAGVPVGLLRPVMERLTLRRFRDERGVELLDLRGAPLPDPDLPVPVRFLPTWDATLLVHARRTQILPERYRGLVFDTKTPHSVSTFLVDGAVAGAWRYADGGIRLQPFERVPRIVMRQLEDEAERLSAFHAD